MDHHGVAHYRVPLVARRRGLSMKTNFGSDSIKLEMGHTPDKTDCSKTYNAVQCNSRWGGPTSTPPAESRRTHHLHILTCEGAVSRVSSVPPGCHRETIKTMKWKNNYMAMVSFGHPVRRQDRMPKRNHCKHKKKQMIEELWVDLQCPHSWGSGLSSRVSTTERS